MVVFPSTFNVDIPIQEVSCLVDSYNTDDVG